MKYTWSWTNIAAVRIPLDDPRRIMTSRQIPSSGGNLNPLPNLAHSLYLKVSCFKVTFARRKTAMTHTRLSRELVTLLLIAHDSTDENAG